MRIAAVAFDARTPDGANDNYHVGVNVHRRLVVKYKVPRDVDGALLGALVSSWSWIGWPQWPALTLEIQLWHAHAVKNSSAIEAYWLDAGWFNGGFPSGVGNWQIPIDGTVDVAEFPGGTLHPEFLLHSQYEADLLDLGNDAARGFITEYLISAVGNYSLDVLRLDFNTESGPNWVAADAPGRAGIAELRYVAGLYRMWDDNLPARPGLLIDDYASGGRCIDLETLGRSVPLWRSDNAGSPEEQQVQTMGLSGFAPLSAGGVSGWDEYTWRSSGVVAKTIDWGLASWQTLVSQPAAMAQLRAAVAETIRVRPLAIWGDFYPLTPIALDIRGLADWAAYQFHCAPGALPDAGGCIPSSGLAWVFRRASAGAVFAGTMLHGIAPAATYSVNYSYTYALNRTHTLLGSQLAALHLNMDAAGGNSTLIEYMCVAGC
jgi:alpha-galactosidase